MDAPATRSAAESSVAEAPFRRPTTMGGPDPVLVAPPGAPEAPTAGAQVNATVDASASPAARPAQVNLTELPA